MANAQNMKRKPQAVDIAAKPGTEKPVARAADNKAPGYLQAKMKVSQPGDAHELQADQVAERVSRAAKPDMPVTGADKAVQRATLQPGEDLGDQQQTLSRKPDQTKPESTLSKKPQDNLAKKADPQSLQAKGDVPQIDQTTEERINSLRGNGEPLPEALKNEMQQQLQADFSAVRIHNSGEAAALAAGINARAFTVGNDIFFATGEYAPDSAEGRKLLAHELTHVVQQTGGVALMVQRTPDADSDTASSNRYSVNSGDYAGTSINMDSNPANRSLSLPKLNLPHLKQRNSGLFPKPLQVRQGRRPNTDQTNKFRNAVNTAATTKLTALTNDARTQGALSPPDVSPEMFFFTLTNNREFMLFGTRESLLPRIQIPIWDQQGHSTNFQVDHIREMQLNGEDNETNYELLEGDANMGAGRAIAGQLRDTIKGGLDALTAANSSAGIPSSNRWSNVKDNYQVSFADFEWSLAHDGSANGGRFWSLQKILDGDHVNLIRPMRARERESLGTTAIPAVFASAQGGEALPSIARPRSNWITRVDLVSWTPAEDAGGDNLGTLMIDAFKGGNAVSTSPDYPSQPWVVKRIPGMNAGYIDPASYTVSIRNSLRLPGMSPIELEQISLSRSGITGEGRVLPTIPLIRDADIRIRINGNEAQVYKTFSMEELPLPAPFSMESCDLTVFYGSTSGLGIDGRAEFAVERLGQGVLGASASTAGGFALEGGFDFDSQLFDRAHISMWYRNDQFGAEGDIGIDTPNKIRGIRAANLHMTYDAGAFNASGDVQPNIPGVQQAGLTVAYSEAAGLTIGGNLQLTANPAIRSGSIDVTLTKPSEAWKVSATGSVQPAIPGIDSELTVSYDDGAFSAEFSGAFQRGMLAGNATVGVTNRAVGEDGRASGDPLPDGALNVYGSGAATLQIAPWLQGSVGITFAPNGEVTVVGEIGLPSAVELLPRKQVERNLFSVGTSIPIVPGIVARIAGGADAVAGFGPGQLDQMNLRVEYNPSHEENTHISGGAHLNVPADAGVRLFVRAGIGLGIPGASATGGLEIGGQLGIAGAAEASVNFDWTPTTGLEINAEGYIHAQPRFVFDISGYVEVEALWITVYEQRWNFASFEYGSDLTFGVRFPIHYQEGQPFDIALSDVQFETPNIDTDAILSGLIDRIA